MGLKDMLSRTWRTWLHPDDDFHTPPSARAAFRLLYQGTPVGFLTVADGRWRFQYSEEFRRQKHLRPIVGFADPVKTYESDELWPFFAMRIPGLKQTAVQDIIRQEHIDATDEVQLLRRFGRRTVANPFELVEESGAGAPRDLGREAR